MFQGGRFTARLHVPGRTQTLSLAILKIPTVVLLRYFPQHVAVAAWDCSVGLISAVCAQSEEAAAVAALGALAVKSKPAPSQPEAHELE